MSEVIGIFSSIRDLNEAVDKLLSHGFNQHSLRVIANELVFNTQFHLNYKTIYDVINDQSIPKKPFYAEENIAIAEGAVMGFLVYICTLGVAWFAIEHREETIQFIIMILIAILVSTIIGIILAISLDRHHKKYINSQLIKGGIPIWIHYENTSQQKLIELILKNNNAKNIIVFQPNNFQEK